MKRYIQKETYSEFLKIYSLDYFALVTGCRMLIGIPGEKVWRPVQEYSDIFKTLIIMSYCLL